VVTYQFINVPAAVLSALHCIGHSRIHPKMPVEMPSFALFTFLGSKKSPSASPALVWSSFIQRSNQVRTWSI
jgi:hypothetical protein